MFSKTQLKLFVWSKISSYWVRVDHFTYICELFKRVCNFVWGINFFQDPTQFPRQMQTWNYVIGYSYHRWSAVMEFFFPAARCCMKLLLYWLWLIWQITFSLCVGKKSFVYIEPTLCAFLHVSERVELFSPRRQETSQAAYTAQARSKLCQGALRSPVHCGSKPGTDVWWNVQWCADSTLWHFTLSRHFSRHRRW